MKTTEKEVLKCLLFAQMLRVSKGKIRKHKNSKITDQEALQLALLKKQIDKLPHL